jgi:hypothetical protein
MKATLRAVGIPWLLSVLYGIGGNLLLLFFLGTLLPFTEAAKFLPWAVAFTGAASGYTFLDKVGTGLSGRYGWSAGCGAAVGLLTWALINLSARFVAQIGMLSFVYLLVFAGVCTACSLLGAGLAVKFHRLNSANGSSGAVKS